MAAKSRRQVKKLKFELTRSAVVGIGVVVFCLFLWMFLIGVWAGQSLLLPSYGKQAVTVDKSVEELSDPLVIKAEKKAVKR